MVSLFYIVYTIVAISLLIGKYRFDRARNSISHRIAIIGSSPHPGLSGAIAAIIGSSGLHTFGAIDEAAKPSGTILLPDGTRARLTSASRFMSRTIVRLIWSFARRGADVVIYEARAGSRALRWLRPLLSPRTVIVPTVSAVPTVTVADVKRATRLIRNVPRNATLITAEHRHGILSVMRHESRRRSIRLVEIKDGMEGLVSHVGAIFDVKHDQAVRMLSQAKATDGHDKVYDCTHRIRTGLQVIIRKVDAASLASGR